MRISFWVLVLIIVGLTMLPKTIMLWHHAWSQISLISDVFLVQQRDWNTELKVQPIPRDKLLKTKFTYTFQKMKNYKITKKRKKKFIQSNFKNKVNFFSAHELKHNKYEQENKKSSTRSHLQELIYVMITH